MSFNRPRTFSAAVTPSASKPQLLESTINENYLTKLADLKTRFERIKTQRKAIFNNFSKSKHRPVLTSIYNQKRKAFINIEQRLERFEEILKHAQEQETKANADHIQILNKEAKSQLNKALALTLTEAIKQTNDALVQSSGKAMLEEFNTLFAGIVHLSPNTPRTAKTGKPSRRNSLNPITLKFSQLSEFLTFANSILASKTFKPILLKHIYNNEVALFLYQNPQLQLNIEYINNLANLRAHNDLTFNFSAKEIDLRIKNLEEDFAELEEYLPQLSYRIDMNLSLLNGLDEEKHHQVTLLENKKMNDAFVAKQLQNVAVTNEHITKFKKQIAKLKEELKSYLKLNAQFENLLLSTNQDIECTEEILAKINKTLIAIQNQNSLLNLNDDVTFTSKTVRFIEDLKTINNMDMELLAKIENRLKSNIELSMQRKSAVYAEKHKQLFNYLGTYLQADSKLKESKKINSILEEKTDTKTYFQRILDLNTVVSYKITKHNFFKQGTEKQRLVQLFSTLTLKLQDLDSLNAAIADVGKAHLSALKK